MSIVSDLHQYLPGIARSAHIDVCLGDAQLDFDLSRVRHLLRKTDRSLSHHEFADRLNAR
jgi:hypothetical protein